MNSDQSSENEKEIVPPPDSTPDAPVTPATPEEQMARFEEALKEEDWGHQPC